MYGDNHVFIFRRPLFRFLIEPFFPGRNRFQKRPATNSISDPQTISLLAIILTSNGSKDADLRAIQMNRIRLKLCNKILNFRDRSPIGKGIKFSC